VRPKQLGDRLRDLLLTNPLGMTVYEMSSADGTPMDTIIGALYRNYGFYIGGWQRADTGKYRALWCVVRVPMDAPRPTHAEVIRDTQEAIKQRKLAEYKKSQQKALEMRKKASEQLKAIRAIEKLEAAKRKAESKALREKAKAEERAERAERKAAAKREAMAKAAMVAWQPPIEDDDPTIIRTRWVKVQPWPQGVRP
jgi:hypothetical protein